MRDVLGNEIRSAEIFMKICATDTAEGWFDLLRVMQDQCKRTEAAAVRIDEISIGDATDLDLSFPASRYFYFIQPDVLLSMKPHCLHLPGAGHGFSKFAKAEYREGRLFNLLTDFDRRW